MYVSSRCEPGARRDVQIPPISQPEGHHDMMITTRAEVRGRVRRKYLSMISVALLLTISCPGSRLWSTSTVGTASIGHQLSLIEYNSHVNESASRLSDDSTVVKILDANPLPNISSSHNNTLETRDFSPVISSLYGTIKILELAKLLFQLAILIASFFAVLGSNPGWLNSDTISRLGHLESNILDEENSRVELEMMGFNSNMKDDEIDQSSVDVNNDSAEAEKFLPIHPENANMSSSNGTEITTLYPYTRRKFCDRCNIFPPLRSHHCQICNKCVATFDHHCIFLGTCIGERNHFRFWLFVWMNLITLSTALNIVNSGKVVLQNQIGEKSFSYFLPVIGHIILLVSKVYLCTICLVVSVLCAVHSALAMCNSTTFECGKGGKYIDYLRGTEMTDFPFSRGLFGNIALFVIQDDASRRVLNSKVLIPCLSSRLHQRIRKFFNYFVLLEEEKGWTPMLWKMPDQIVRDSEEWWNHPWQNKYWSCC
ncbi:hypothetical protein ACHAXS_013570 [Conticribra weissflogii]